MEQTVLPDVNGRFSQRQRWVALLLTFSLHDSKHSGTRNRPIIIRYHHREAMPSPVVVEPLVEADQAPQDQPSSVGTQPLKSVGRTRTERAADKARAARQKEEAELFQIAESHLRQKYWEKAHRVAYSSGVRETQPRRAWRIIGLSACHRNNLELARTSWRYVDRETREEIARTCKETTGFPLVSKAFGMEALQRARQLYRQQRYMSALVEARSAVGGGHLAGWGIIGLVACRRHDRTAVRDAYRSARPEDQRAMLAACRNEGIGVSE